MRRQPLFCKEGENQACDALEEQLTGVFVVLRCEEAARVPDGGRGESVEENVMQDCSVAPPGCSSVSGASSGFGGVFIFLKDFIWSNQI